jgi:tetratricopeptide (TPR) repeat protein
MFRIRILLFLLALASIGNVAEAPAQIEARGNDPARPWAADADELLGEGRFAEAETSYLALAGEHGEDPGLWTRIAYTRLQMGRLAMAMEAAVRATELGPEDLDAILIRAQCEAVAGDVESAAATLQKGLELDPGNTALLESMTATFIALERWPEAAGLLRELIRTNPNEAAYYMDLGKILLTSGEFTDAVAAFGQARALGADEALALALTGKAHLAAGQWEQAMVEFDQSIALQPNADAYGGRATIHYLEGDAAAAVSEFRRAVELAPGDPDLHFNLGNMLVQTGDGAGAEASYRAALALDPNIAEAHLNLGILMLNRLQIAPAEQHLRMAAQLDQELDTPWLHLARIANARFQFEESRRIYGVYKSRVQDPAEQRRIDEVIAELDLQIEVSREAVARGEIHLLQARFSSEEGALDLIAQVRQGGDFYLLAGQLSDLGELAGVDAGFMDPAGAQSVIREAVSPLEVGEMTDPVQLAENWFVFMRVE